jgi:hypothetical protein
MIRSVRYKRHCYPATQCLSTATLTTLPRPRVSTYTAVPYPASPQNDLFTPYIAGSTFLSGYLNIFQFSFSIRLHSLNSYRVTSSKLSIRSRSTRLRWGVFQVGPVFRASPVGPNIALPSQVLPFPSSSFQLKIPFPSSPPTPQLWFIACEFLSYSPPRSFLHH